MIATRGSREVSRPWAVRRPSALIKAVVAFGLSVSASSARAAVITSW